MHLQKITTSNFRNLAPQEIEFRKRITVFIGRNAQGKTSLLEAIYLLGHMRSFRAGRLGELVRWGGENRLAVSAELETLDGKRRVRYEITGDRRQVFINDTRVTSAPRFYGNVRVLEFTPDDLALVKGAPALRRHYLDRLLALTSRSFVEEILAYQRALKSRNALLLSQAGASELRAWTDPLIEHGTVVVQKRMEVARFIAERLCGIYSGLVGNDTEERVRARYASGYLDEEGELLGAASLRLAYEERDTRDRSRKATTFGPHRDELLLELNVGSGPRPAREAASQGQSRCLALALKLAGIEYLRNCGEEEPIVLLDDVESELDEGRRAALIESIVALKSQVIVSTTDATTLPKRLLEGAGFFLISHGSIEPLGS